MRKLRFRHLAALAALPLLVSVAQAQTLRGPYYQRTTTPGFMAPRGAARAASPTIANTNRGWDRLQPYTQTSARTGARAAAAPLGSTYSSHPRVAPPRMLPPPPPAGHNYYPTARIGQGPNRNVGHVGDRCTPSRGGMILGLR